MSNPSPAITFLVDLTPLANESFGTNTNISTVGVSRSDGGVIDNRVNVRSGLIPAFTICPDRKVIHGDTFVEYGQKAVYLKNTFGIGYSPADRAILTIVSIQ